MNKENIFINYFKSELNGDDGAVVGKWVYSSDSFFENVHFKKEWMSSKQIATKAMLVNISDAIAMNAKPKFALLNVAIPPNYSTSDLRLLAKGFLNVAKKFNIEIIGGDTIANDKLDISVTIISKTKKPLFRKGMKEGDLIAYTGNLGDCKRDLEILLSKNTINKKSKFITPSLHPKFIKKIRKFLNCGIDISDGLFFELQRLSKINNLGVKLLQDINNEVGCSGEEYEMLFSFSPIYLERIEQIAAKFNIKINICAEAILGGIFICPCKPHHF